MMSYSKNLADTPLVTYRNLAPEKANHRQLADLTEHWLRGTVTGRLVDSGWGLSLAFLD